MDDEAPEATGPGSGRAETPAAQESPATPRSSEGPSSPNGASEGKPETPAAPDTPPVGKEEDKSDTPTEEPPPGPGTDGPEAPERDERPYLKRAQDDEREWQQRKRNLNDLDEEDAARAGRDWIGGDANRVTGGGSIFTAARDIWIGAHTGEQAPQIRYLARSEANRLTACMVEPQSQAELAAALDREPLVFLRGGNGTGRRSAALAALLSWVRTTDGAAQHADPEHVGIIPSASATQRAEPELRTHHGYVLDTASSGDAPGFEDYADRLRHLAERHGCRVIVLMPSDWSDRSRRIVEHASPDASEVFRRRLEFEARGAGVDEHLLDGIWVEVNDDLCLENSPGEAAQLACWLVAKLKAGLSPDDLRAELPRRVRDDIRRRLADGGPVLGRCFMTSAAVLNELPETTVSDKAMRLAEHINEVSSVRGEERPPAWQHLHSWLEYADATTRPGDAAGIGPTVHLRRRVEKATLRVLWEEQPTIREPLLAWLRETAEDGDPSVQTKAAHAAGILATFDFDTAVARFITPWSRSGRLRNYRIAAMMLESAVGDPDVAPLVYALLRKFVDGVRGERLVAAHALGSRIGLNAPGVALRELRKIALSRDTEVGKAVAGSIGNLYSAGSAEQILRELTEWVSSGSPGGLYTSALAFVRLAVIGNADPDRPALSRLEFNGNVSEQLAVLWRNSLSLRVVASATQRSELIVPDSWIVLARWVSQYNNEPVIRAVIDEVFGASGGTRRLRSALLLHLRHWQHRNQIPADVYARLVKMMKVG